MAMSCDPPTGHGLALEQPSRREDLPPLSQESACHR